MADDLRVPKPRDLPPGQLEERRAHLMAELQHGNQKRRRRRRRLLVLVPAVAVTSAAFAATSLFDEQDVDEFTRVHCYAQASLDSRSAKAPITFGEKSALKPGELSATEQCARLWRSAKLGRPGAAPPLEACVYRGEIAVFPGATDGICERLKLRRLASGHQAKEQKLAAAYYKLIDLFATCGDPKEITRQIKQVMRKNGFDADGLQPLPLDPRRGCGPGFPRKYAKLIVDGLPARDTVDSTLLGGPTCFEKLSDVQPGTWCELGLGDYSGCAGANKAKRIVSRRLAKAHERAWHLKVVQPRSLSDRFCYSVTRIYPRTRTIRLLSVVRAE